MLPLPKQALQRLSVPGLTLPAGLNGRLCCDVGGCWPFGAVPELPIWVPAQRLPLPPCLARPVPALAACCSQSVQERLIAPNTFVPLLSGPWLLE